MTLAAGYKFEHPKAQGLSPILLLSDSRYSYSGGTTPPCDTGKKLHTYATAINIAAVFAGYVEEAKRALILVGERLASSSSGSFEEIREILKSSFDSKITTWGDPNTPHCLLGAISTRGDSKLFYAQPYGKSYEVSEVPQAVIGDERLKPKLQKKIDAHKPSGLWHPKHFMCLPDDMFPEGYDPTNRAIQDAREISGNISRAFLETVDDPSVHTAKSPLQNILLLPSGPQRFDLYDIGSPTQIIPKTHRPNEVHYD